MDHLVELQRDGLIKSIAGKGFTPMALRDLDRNGFRFDSHEMDINLLNSNHYYNAESKLAAADLDLPLLASSPLAGGLLTSRWHGKVYPPLSREMASPQQHKYILTALRKWCHTQQQTPSKSAPLSELQVWDQYQKKVLPLLDEISQYHEVSLASIALRWALQLDHVGNTAVRCNLMKEDEDIQGNLSRRLKHLRDVFRFELSGEDMDRLGELSKSPQSDMEKAMDEEEEELRRMMRNRSLWL